MFLQLLFLVIYPRFLVVLKCVCRNSKTTFLRFDFGLIYYSAFIWTQGTQTISDVWLLCYPLTPDCLEVRGDKVKVKGKRKVGEVTSLSSIWRLESPVSGSAEPRQSQTSVWGETGLCVKLLWSCTSYHVGSRSPLWPWKSKQGLLMPRDRQEWYFPHHIRRLNTSNDSNADKHKSTSLWYKFKFKSVTQLLFLI